MRRKNVEFRHVCYSLFLTLSLLQSPEMTEVDNNLPRTLLTSVVELADYQQIMHFKQVVF